MPNVLNFRYSSGAPSEVIRQYDLDTVFDGDADFNVIDKDFIIRSPQTLGMQPNEIAIQTEDTNDEEYEDLLKEWDAKSGLFTRSWQRIPAALATDGL